MLRIKYAVGCIVLISAFSASSVNAEFFTGNKLIQFCENASGFAPLGTYLAAVIDRDEADLLKVMGAISGIKESGAPLDAQAAGVAALQSIADREFCVPKGVSLGQARDVFCMYLRRHPENRHEGGTWLATLALKEAFPCRNSGGSKK